MTKELISTRIDKAILAQVNREANENNRSRSNMIEVLLSEALKSRKKKKK